MNGCGTVVKLWAGRVQALEQDLQTSPAKINVMTKIKGKPSGCDSGSPRSKFCCFYWYLMKNCNISDLHLISFFSFEGAEIKKKKICPYLLHFKVAVAAVDEEKGQALYIVRVGRR